ncbi:WD40/YVTN/BNR-like repeat-containing protein [Candidatus Palauibacter sp.]|uniref:WD40/YVTN/BNR-like repeat-containing protein n=1 Tax=Candidatus Palauibacter sp. TaxID=3101350 RepID=UPI003B01A7E2
MLKRVFLPVVFATIVLPASATGQQAVADEDFMSEMEWRSIGPANMSGRVTDIEGVPGTGTFFVAGATSGVWKTTNHGTTFRPVFDNERVISMGDLAIAPSNPDIVWAGTGEEDSRNSISPGGGIYKSVDGGLTWEMKGLEGTQAIGRIVIHPAKADWVYVAALGHPWGDNEERGLYRTKDGGDAWERVNFVSDKAGFVDIDMHPRNPDILWATSWERVRGPYFLQSGGPGSAIWKSTDAGDTWEKVEGNGLPETMLGRLEIAIAPSYPQIMYAVVEAEAPDEADENGDRNASGLYRSEDGGETWEFMNSSNSRPFYYSGAWVSPDDPDFIYWSSLFFSRDGGRTVGNPAQGVHVDYHALWWDSSNPDHFILGNDGGIAITWDGGGNFEFPNRIPMGQFYAVSYNMDTPYRVCGGLQDNYTWCGPSRRAGGAIDNHMWYSIGGGDGFYAPQDPTNPDIVFGESQQGRIYWRNTRTGERHQLQQPDWRERTQALRDSVAILSGDDPDDPPAANVAQIEELQALVAQDSALFDMRFNWNTPLEMSPHDPQTLYIGANRVLKWTYDTDEMTPISDDLTYADPEKIEVAYNTTGGITPDVTGAENFATIVSLAESKTNEGELYAGTDDGRVWRTPEGAEWIELTDRFEGVPEGTYVSRIEPSSHDPNRFYVTFDNHRRDDYTPYVYATDDGGETFRSIASNLPAGAPDFVHVIREDPVNEDLLFVGTDVGAYVSTDRGGSWSRFMDGLPTVPVHDLRIHPREREIIAGTHGRSIFVADISLLQELDGGRLPEAVTVFQPRTAIQYADPPVGGEFMAQGTFRGDAGEYGAEVSYFIPEDIAEQLAEAAREEREARREEGAERRAPGDRAGLAAVRPGGRGPAGAGGGGAGLGAQASVAILNSAGDTVQVIDGSASAGVNRVRWTFNRRAAPAEPSPADRADSIRNARMYAAVGDSLVEHEDVDREVMDHVLEMMQGGNQAGLRRMFGGGGRGGGGFGGGDTGGWQDRPAERYPQAGQAAVARGGAAAAASGAPAGGGADEGGPDPASMREVFQQLTQAMRERGGGGGGFRRFFGGGGGGGGGLADPGTYTVAITLGEETFTTTLEVVRKEGFGFWDEPDTDDRR